MCLLTTTKCPFGSTYINITHHSSLRRINIKKQVSTIIVFNPIKEKKIFFKNKVNTLCKKPPIHDLKIVTCERTKEFVSTKLIWKCIPWDGVKIIRLYEWKRKVMLIVLGTLIPVIIGGGGWTTLFTFKVYVTHFSYFNNKKNYSLHLSYSNNINYWTEGTKTHCTKQIIIPLLQLIIEWCLWQRMVNILNEK